MFKDMPLELRNLPQWVVWRLEDLNAKKPTKVPYDCKTGKRASHSDPNTWSNFDVALSALNTGMYNGIGFVLSEEDPYTFIDFDESDKPENWERHNKIASHFQSYAEISPSGRGLHIIVKGSVPCGRKRNGIEIYSSHRYMTMTGNVYKDIPIMDYNEDVNTLWSEMAVEPTKAYYYLGLEEEQTSDDQIFKTATNASNGQLFTDLWEGNWIGKYPSQSEADFALIDILSFYSKNRNQIKRLFNQSGLFRNKQTTIRGTGYLDHMINRSFDNMLPPINIDSLNNQLIELIKKRNQPRATETIREPIEEEIIPTNDVYTLPPGLLGEIARFIYQQAPRQVPEIALAGAIGCMAGITGRAYNVDGTGLNQYLILIAKTGRGKSAMRKGITALFKSVTGIVPAAKEFLGPDAIGSAQGITKYMQQNPSIVSVFGEFARTMKDMCRKNTPGHLSGIKTFLLSIYEMSGHGQTLQPTVYSDKDKNTVPINSPSFSLLGEGTPKFYDSISEDLIADGFLPRFTIIDYDGKRVGRNKNHHLVQPSYELIEQFANLCAYSLSLNNENKVIEVEFDDDAEQFMEWLELKCDDKINSSENELTSELWNRVGIKSMKLAALVAIGVNPINPVITKDHIKWATGIIVENVSRFTTKFDIGEITMSSEENAQLLKMIDAIYKFISSDFSQVARYCQGQSNLHKDKIIPYSYLQRKLISVAAYRKDNRGATEAIKRTIRTLQERGDIQELNRAELAKKYDTSARCFIVKNMSMFEL